MVWGRDRIRERYVKINQCQPVAEIHIDPFSKELCNNDSIIHHFISLSKKKKKKLLQHLILYLNCYVCCCVVCWIGGHCGRFSYYYCRVDYFYDCHDCSSFVTGLNEEWERIRLIRQMGHRNLRRRVHHSPKRRVHHNLKQRVHHSLKRQGHHS